MNIKQSAKILEDKYMTMNGIYSVGIISCAKCGGDYIEILMDTQNRSLLTSIPQSFQGFRIEKVHRDKPVETQYDTEIFAPVYPYPYMYGAVYGIPVPVGGRFRPRGGGGHHHGGGGRRR